VFSCFWLFHCEILETQQLFTRTHFTHKTTYAYLSLFTDCWNMQENSDLDLFWAGDSRFWGGFPPFCILAPRIQTCHFLIAPKNCIFWGASFEPIKNLATLDPEKLQGFHGTPLCLCYTLKPSIKSSINSSKVRATGSTLREIFSPELEAAARWRCTRDVAIRHLVFVGHKSSVYDDAEIRTRHKYIAMREYLFGNFGESSHFGYIWVLWAKRQVFLD